MREFLAEPEGGGSARQDNRGWFRQRRPWPATFRLA